MKGDGLEKDLVEALKWLRLAAQQGEKSAAEIADKLQVDMTDEQLAQSERRIATFTPERASVY
jgi:TPR repeat protein